MLKLDKPLSAFITGEGDIFHQLKKLRKVNDVVPTTIDATKDNITGHFANVYERIYNSIDDEEEVAKKLLPSKQVTAFHFSQGCRSYHHRKATLNLKSNRNDPYCLCLTLKNAPLAIVKHLKYLIKSFLIHSHVSNPLLLATLIPIPKDKLGDLT